MGFCRVFAATAGWRDLERGNAGGGCSRWLSREVWRVQACGEELGTAAGRDWEFVLTAGYGTRNWKWPVLVCFGAEGKGKLWLARGENGAGERFWGRKAEEEEGGGCCVFDRGQGGHGRPLVLGEPREGDRGFVEPGVQGRLVCGG